MENVFKKKESICIEKEKKVYAAFMYLEKAYKVNRKALTLCIVHGRLLNTVKGLYNGSSCPGVYRGTSEWFEICVKAV